MTSCGFIVSVRDVEFVPVTLSVTVTLSGKGPDELVVPLMTPVEELSVIPLGKLAAGIDQV